MTSLCADAAPTRAETIAAVLEACDGHYGRITVEQPAAPARPRVRVLPPLAPPTRPVPMERRLCWRCWAASYVVPAPSRRRFCDDCIVYRNRSATDPAFRATRPEVKELSCPFCSQPIYLDDGSAGLTHPAACPEFGHFVSGADFLRKVARALGARA